MANYDPATAAAIDAHAKATLLQPDARLDACVARSDAHGLRNIRVSPLQGQFLAIQCQLMGARSVLEIGTLGGYSAIWFAKAGARVTSIEIDPRHREIALENTKGLDVEVILGAALDVLPGLAAEGNKYDMVFLDAEWSEQAQYFDWAVKLCRAGGCIFLDNAPGSLILNDEVGKEESLLVKVGKDERVQATLVPTIVGKKGREPYYDGFLIAVVLDKP